MSEVFAKIDTVHTPKGPVASTRLICPKIGEREAQIIEEQLRGAAQKHGHRLCVDFGEVTFLTSVGLGMLVTVMKECKAGGGKLVLYAVRKELMDLLKLTHLHKVLTITPDRESGMMAL